MSRISTGIGAHATWGAAVEGILGDVPDVLDYLDYRQYLRDIYEWRKKRGDSFFSYRYIASRIGIDPGYLVKLLQGKVHLGESSIDPTIKLLALEGKAAAFFLQLVLFGKARSDRQIQEEFQKLMALKGVGARTLDEDRFAFYQSWVHSAIRALIGIIPFRGDCADLARRLSPAVTEEEAKASVELLERLELIHRNEEGHYELTERFVTTGDGWRSLAVRTFQGQTMDLAHASLERHAPEIRDISTVTVTLSREDMPELRERIAQFRQDILRLAREGRHQDAVYQFNVQLFPLTEVGK